MNFRQGILTFLVLAALAWLLLHKENGLTDPRAAGVNFANYERIRDGMTLAEVDDLLGVPPGEYWIEPGFHLVGPGHIPRDERSIGGRLEVWYVPRHHLEVLFDKEGRVIGKFWFDPDDPRWKAK